MVKITSSNLLSPRFTICHDAGFVNCCILFVSQKVVLIYAVSQTFVVLHIVFSYIVYIRQADMFLATGRLHRALLNLIVCASICYRCCLRSEE